MGEGFFPVQQQNFSYLEQYAFNTGISAFGILLKPLLSVTTFSYIKCDFVL